MSFKIFSELSENQIESDISSYLGYITPYWKKRYRLISVDEQITGADKLFDRFVPIYFQFKVSQGLKPNATILEQFKNKPLAKIIKFRNDNNYITDPILYFQLRKKAKTATDLQHNILYRLNSESFQHAVYIAPLTLDSQEYENMLNERWFFRFINNPLIRKDLSINDTLERVNYEFRSLPFLRHHIAIPPHKTTDTHNHHYSYSKSGGDVIWHGGEILNKDYRLFNFLLNILNDFHLNEKNEKSQINIGEYLDYLQKELNVHLNSPDNYFKLLYLSEFLKETYNIKLMFLYDTFEY
ncbi:hypothetical protein VUJ46_08685 [Chryseobacterium sp. MYb264]|uniref:hypothetical protein n=1 Tax=Chryseobacterium sp. MYb264 TaxID=2745153 RepID=UPI002E1036AF|nr:hypothetical protein VUJ46_08685 [Chryseobacterium sp. MYb264]